MALTGLYDVIVVGAGPAGVSAALQAHRDGLETLLVSAEPIGGLVAAAWCIKNLPGYSHGISGGDYAAALERHVLEQGLCVNCCRIIRIEKVPAGFHLYSTAERFMSRAVIMACGTRPRPFSCPGMDTALSGIHRDIRSMPDNFLGSQVAIVGGGEAAVDTALSVCDRNGRPDLYVRGQRLIVTGHLLHMVQRMSIPVHFGYELKRIDGDGSVEACWWSIRGQGELLKTTSTQILICVGREPRWELLMTLLDGPPVMRQLTTQIDGLFLAGDLIRGRDRYVATALGDGQQAALCVRNYLEGCDG